MTTTFNDIPIDIQKIIFGMKYKLEDKEKRHKYNMRIEFNDAMYQFLVDYGYWDRFINEFLEDKDEDEKAEYKEFLGVEDEEDFH